MAKNAIAPQVKVFKEILKLADENIMTYTSTQHTMRNELIRRITQYIE
jgi:hypothetical protein